METNTNMTLLTIVAEESLANLIEDEIVNLGAKGFTSAQVSGKGLSGNRDNHWEGTNIRIESVVTKTVCDHILEHLKSKYLDRYAVIAFYQPVTVIRTGHFS